MFSEFFDRLSSIAHDPAHSECIYGIISRNGEKPDAIGKYNMLRSLPQDIEAGLFQSTNGLLVVDAGKFRHR